MDQTLHQAQLVMLESLIELTNFFKENNIKYWLDSGTLLGAIRHQGFIPWDDDIDVCMMRDDFNKFLKIAPALLSNNLFIQTIQTDKFYKKWYIPCRIRINNTFILEKSSVINKVFDYRSHNGLFIDILPMDYLPENKFSEFCIKILKLIYKIKFMNIINDYKLFRIIIKSLGIFFPIKVINFLKLSLTNSFKDNNKIIYGIELPFKKRIFNKEEIFPLQEIKFEKTMFFAPQKHHIYLTKLYGKDYMQPPPVEQRVNHSLKIEIY